MRWIQREATTMRFWKFGLIPLLALIALAVSPRPAAADDYETCEKESGDVAIAACSRALATGRYKGRQLAAIYDNRGVEYANKHDFDRAFADYDEAIRTDPKFAFPYSNRGDARRLNGDVEQGLADLNQAIRLDPNFGNAYYNRGLAWEAKQDLQRALADFKKYAELVPGNPDGPRAIERVTNAMRGK
jgi:tetratricopeptide (TPR) repeat protein